MAGKDIRIKATKGGEFDCYVVLPNTKEQVPAIVVACAVMGVNEDVRNLCDTFAAAGYIACAPDLFWRADTPGPLVDGDERIRPRAQPRQEKIKTGEQDMLDVATAIRKLPGSNGKVATIGLCYGGPYANIGPKRLGYDAGISCHGSQMWYYTTDLEGVTQPVCLIWGSEDYALNNEVKEVYPKMAAKMENVEYHVLPNIKHGYMMALHSSAYDQGAYDFSMQRTLAILEDLKGEGRPVALRKSS
jgi:carboxymethylenebutenolidase